MCRALRFLDFGLDQFIIMIQRGVLKVALDEISLVDNLIRKVVIPNLEHVLKIHDTFLFTLLNINQTVIVSRRDWIANHDI